MDERTRARIAAAIGYLNNLLESEDEEWARNTTYGQAIDSATNWADATWKDYR